ncbi:PqiC family protein [Stenoxybacter acetivorans]|uniref:PqiC family protein n=1 Tax=Stenoxybacter acetivorans TaxID=422441 RepID=UPI00068E1582|nr:ABC-type transport auxiliary lipoprotein family protein [Stenoxybacter acetivorans]
MNTLLRFTAVAIIIGLTACAGNPISYYRLPDSSFQAASNSLPIVRIEVQTADFLNRSNLVYQDSPENVYFARQHLWSEPLNTMLAKAFANDLNRLPERRFAYTAAPAANTPILLIHIEDFQGSHTGYTHISGYSQWQDIKLNTHNFDIHTAQQGNGYTAMVQSLRQGVRDAAKSIAP